MRILFAHQNFPGQFRHVAPALAERGHEVAALAMRERPSFDPRIRLIRWEPRRGSTPGIHPWAADFETKVIRGEQAFRAMSAERAAGYAPEIVIAHPGWGESLFVNEVWPKARLGIYCEFYYRPEGADVGFDPEFPVTDEGDACRIRLKNLNMQLHFDSAAAGLAPTQWQADGFPQRFRDRITVVHDGIDTGLVAPRPETTITLGSGLVLSKTDEIVTYVSRNLEPYRGFHVFMRALPEILRRRATAHVLIVGGPGVSYGPRPKDGRSWRDIFVGEVRPLIPDRDWQRVHFLGNLPYQQFLAVLQVSSVHVYLTYPFVLSWSLLEAMSAGCAVVASDTPPLQETIRNDDTGRLVPFFDRRALAEHVCELLAAPAERARLGRRAREFAREVYDLKTICLPKQLAWVERLGRAFP